MCGEEIVGVKLVEVGSVELEEGIEGELVDNGGVEEGKESWEGWEGVRVGGEYG